MDFVETLVNELIRSESAQNTYHHDHFKADIHEANFKLDLLSLKLPLFSIEGGNKRQTQYQTSDYCVHVRPGLSGQPTIKDKELLIFCISQLVEGRNRGRKDLSNKLRIVPYHFLTMFRRGTRGQDYTGLLDALKRLKETTITINLKKTPKIFHSFSLVQAWSYVHDMEETEQRRYLEVELPEITIKQFEKNQILTLSSSYIDIRSPTERRIYEIARSYCGKSAEWNIGIQNLYMKTGCDSSLKKFKWRLKSCSNFPGYRASIDEGKGQAVFKNTSTTAGISSIKQLKKLLRTPR